MSLFGRRNNVFAPGTTATRSYDDTSMAQVVQEVQAAPRYSERVPQVELTVLAAADDPNTTEPAVGAYLPAREFGQVAFFAQLEAGQAVSVEVWTRSDADDLWLLVDTKSALVNCTEYLVNTRFRDVFLRPQSVNLNGGAAIVLRACSVA